MRVQVGDVFQAKLDVAASSFLYPIAFGLFDAYDPTTTLSVKPLTSYAGSRVQGCTTVTNCLRPRLGFDPRAGQAFRCRTPSTISQPERDSDDVDKYKKELADAWSCCEAPAATCPAHYGCTLKGCWTTEGGCDCSGRKKLSLTASSVFVTGTVFCVPTQPFVCPRNPTWPCVLLLTRQPASYAAGMDGTETKATILMGSFTSHLGLTAWMDALVDAAWLSSPNWIQVFLGIKSNDPSTGMFRSFPGSVREALPPSFNNKPGTPEGRLYNVQVRPWFTAAMASAMQGFTFQGGRKDQLQAKRPTITLTEPYTDADGKGDLVTLAAPIITYDASNPAGAVKGVVGSDLVVESLRSLVNSIRFRETGEAFVFHKDTKLVLASQQLTTQDTIAGKLPTIDQLSWLSGSPNKFGKDDMYKRLCVQAADTDKKKTDEENYIRVGSGNDEVMMVSGEVWQGKYCLVMVTKVKEIEEPITAQIDAIEKSAMTLFLAPMVTAAVCGGVLLTIVILLAHCISRPLVSTACDSKEIVKCIGGDLSQMHATGEEDDKNDAILQQTHKLGSQGEVGEMSDLRQRFTNLLHDLLQKREKSRGHVNPFLRQAGLEAAVQQQGVGTLPSGERVPIMASNDVSVNVMTHTESGNRIRPPFKSRATRFNVVAMQLRLWLILPLAVILIIIVVTSAVALRDKAESWAEPVRAKLIEEEMRSLDQRVKQRAAALSETLIAGTNTIKMVKHYWLRLLDGQDSWRDANTTSERLLQDSGFPNPSYFSPHNDQRCQQYTGFGVQCEQPGNKLVKEELPPGKKSVASFEERMISVQSSSFYRPLPLPAKKAPTTAGDSVYSYGSDSEEVRALADLDNVLRVAYFSADVTSVYVAVHDKETFKMFPYENLQGYDKEKICDSVENKPDDVWVAESKKKEVSYYKNVKSSTYNPVCRPWYQRAQRSSPKPLTATDEPRGRVVFNPIDFDAGTNLPYLSLSSAVWRGADQNEMVGVVSMDLNLAAINQTLSSTDLYKRGYVLVWDDNLMTVVHKSMKAGLERYDIPWVDATAGGRDQVDEDWMAAQDKKMFAKGRVSGSFNFTYKGEIWHYTFMPVPNTPYMIGLSVVYPEVTARADKMSLQLRSLVQVMIIFITGALAVVCFVLVWFSDWFNRRAGQPVSALADYVGQMKEIHYAQDLPAEEPGSAELQEISFNMQRMLIALRFGDSQFSRGDKGLEFKNCTEALEIILELGNARGRGVCLNNMGLCLSAMCDPQRKSKANSLQWSQTTCQRLQVSLYPKLMPTMQSVKQLHAARPEFQSAFSQFERNPMDPDVYLQLAVLEAKMSQSEANTESTVGRTQAIGRQDTTLATRLCNRALHLVKDSSFQPEQARDLLEQAHVVASGDATTLATMAWSVCKTLREALFEPKHAALVAVLRSMCQRAQGLLAELEGGGGVVEDFANTTAQVCMTLCLLDSPDIQLARAWAALSSIPRMSPELLRGFIWCAITLATFRSNHMHVVFGAYVPNACHRLHTFIRTRT